MFFHLIHNIFIFKIQTVIWEFTLLSFCHMLWLGSWLYAASTSLPHMCFRVCVYTQQTSTQVRMCIAHTHTLTSTHIPPPPYIFFFYSSFVKGYYLLLFVFMYTMVEIIKLPSSKQSPMGEYHQDRYTHIHTAHTARNKRCIMRPSTSTPNQRMLNMRGRWQPNNNNNNSKNHRHCHSTVNKTKHKWWEVYLQNEMRFCRIHSLDLFLYCCLHGPLMCASASISPNPVFLVLL